MFFNNLNPGPVSAGNYQQPDVRKPVSNPQVASTVGIPATTVSAQPNAQQPDYRKPTVSAGVASYPTGKNPLNIEAAQPVYVQEGTFPHYGGNMPKGVVPPLLNPAF